MNIIEAIEDPRFFRPLFRNISTWAGWIVFMKAVFGIPITDPAEMRLFESCTGLASPRGTRAREVYCVAGRRSGKSWISSVIAVYLACFKDWRPHLSPGERGMVFIVACDKIQSSVIQRYVSTILHSNHSFEKMIERETSERIDLVNNITIMIKTASFRTIRGFTLLCAILEELAFWRSDETSSNPDKEILNAVRPALSTVPGSLLIGISSPYARSGVLWERFHSHFGDPDTSYLVWRAPTTIMNPTISQSLIDEAIREDPVAARTEWQAEFRDDLESYLSVEMIEQAVVPGRHELPCLRDVTYHAFCDPSGGRADSFTLAIVHLDHATDKIIVDRIEERRPPLAPQDVVKEYSAILHEFSIHRITGDRYSGEWVSQAFLEDNVHYEVSKLDKSEIYLEFEPLIAQGRVELLDSGSLCGQFRSLERRTRSGGRDRVDHPPGAKDDLANACAGACVLAKENEWSTAGLAVRLMASEQERTEEEKFNAYVSDWLMDRPTKDWRAEVDAETEQDDQT